MMEHAAGNQPPALSTISHLEEASGQANLLSHQNVMSCVWHGLS
jgi:hypothetical protein